LFRPPRKKISSRTHKNDLISLKKPEFPHGNAYLYGVQYVAYLSFKVVIAKRPAHPRDGCESVGRMTVFGLPAYGHAGAAGSDASKGMPDGKFASANGNVTLLRRSADD
jgi:hypothetical protein